MFKKIFMYSVPIMGTLGAGYAIQDTSEKNSSIFLYRFLNAEPISYLDRMFLKGCVGFTIGTLYPVSGSYLLWDRYCGHVNLVEKNIEE